MTLNHIKYAVMSTKVNGLKMKYHRFAEAYVSSGVGSASAIEAGYKADNASAVACRLLKRPEIVARVEEIRLAKSIALDQSKLARVQKLKDKDLWLAEVLDVYTAIDNVESPQKLKALELAGKSFGHLAENERLNLFSIDNRTLNTQIEITAEALKIADKLKLLQSITLKTPAESSQHIAPIED